MNNEGLNALLVGIATAFLVICWLIWLGIIWMVDRIADGIKWWKENL